MQSNETDRKGWSDTALDMVLNAWQRGMLLHCKSEDRKPCTDAIGLEVSAM